MWSSPVLYTCVLVSIVIYIVECAVTIKKVCPDSYVPCSDSSNSQCVHEYKWCNAEKDCPNGEDEFNCTMCTGSSVKCPNEDKCIKVHQLCDGNPDCRNGVEDIGCSNRCKSDQFECWDGSCINSTVVCCGICNEKTGPGCEGVTPLNCPVF